MRGKTARICRLIDKAPYSLALKLTQGQESLQSAKTEGS